ncbi:hypothetical protein SH668x_003444 [Planctomicrobium sp. SH668]|uniref:hypothetical protein n=1 Tax=Planctomicrobium sp. SH668 TaxID=3448126 RepID=UPI003F5AE6CB
MEKKTTNRTRVRKSEPIPTPARIAKERVSIQATWTTRERQRRRVDQSHKKADPRIQAQLRFIKFLLEYEAACN